MGLDKTKTKCYGLSINMKWLLKIIGKKKQREIGPLEKREQALYRVGREQFLRLKEKGLTIPIFTL